MLLCLLGTVIYNVHSQSYTVKTEKYWGYKFPFGNRGINFILQDAVNDLMEKIDVFIVQQTKFNTILTSLLQGENVTMNEEFNVNTDYFKFIENNANTSAENFLLIQILVAKVDHLTERMDNQFKQLLHHLALLNRLDTFQHTQNSININVMYTIKYILESLYGKVYGDNQHPFAETFQAFKHQLKKKIGGPISEDLSQGNGEEFGPNILKTLDNMIVHGNLFQYWQVEARKDSDSPNNQNVPIFVIDPMVLFTRNATIYIAGQQNTQKLWDNSCPALLQLGGQQHSGNRDIHRISIMCKYPTYNDWNTTVQGLHYSLHDSADPNIEEYTRGYIADEKVQSYYKALHLKQGYYTMWVGNDILLLPERLHSDIRNTFIPHGYEPVIEADLTTEEPVDKPL